MTFRKNVLMRDRWDYHDPPKTMTVDTGLLESIEDARPEYGGEIEDLRAELDATKRALAILFRALASRGAIDADEINEIMGNGRYEVME